VDACEEYNINTGCHHNALDDARACANVLLAHSGKIFADVFVMDRKHIAEKKWLSVFCPGFNWKSDLTR
ncbi:MAG: hypothetical protein IJY44_07055, partial [Bacteroidaceae bacterium]|nr:hypothetical protein [Bacteroidaceae bacterium]